MEDLNDYTYGTCRCCLALGNHRDMNKEYYKSGIREVYLETVLECFNLFLTSLVNMPHLICAVCIARLEDAKEFKMQILDTERSLLGLSAAKIDVGMKCDPLGSENVPLVNEDCNETKVKSEIQVEVKLEEEYEPTDSCDIIVDDYNKIIEDSSVEGEKELLKRFPGKSLSHLPNRKALYKICPKYVRSLDSLRDKLITPKAIEKKFYQNNIQITERLAQALNATTLLECSNIVPFKSKTKSGYPCFYCRQIHEDINSLRRHQVHHSKAELFKLLAKGRADSMVVYADVTNLKCSLCDMFLNSLAELKCHLKTVHGKRLYEQFTDRVIPFKLIGLCDFECQVCGFSFETFGTIERHMNVHYRNFVCEKCGAGFITKHRLKLHQNMQHKEGKYPCHKCKKTFTTYLKFKMHYDVIHDNKKPNKCIICSERFIDYFTRQRHMVEKHGYKRILYKCRVCDKAFSRRYSLSMHLRRCHLSTKDVKCDQCTYTCITNSELRAHMAKHETRNMQECGVCKKSYARMKTLKQHMRIHHKDEFVQNFSLQKHTEENHDDQY